MPSAESTERALSNLSMDAIKSAVAYRPSKVPSWQPEVIVMQLLTIMQDRSFNMGCIFRIVFWRARASVCVSTS